MINSGNLDFSFSGLKTAVVNIVQDPSFKQNPKQMANLAASIQAAIVDVLVKKTIRAARIHKVDQIVVAGGVAANQTLSKELTHAVMTATPPLKLFIPQAKLCTDNAAYIATAALFNYHPVKNPLNIQANPNLSLTQDQKLS